MIRKCHNHKLQTNPWQHEEEPHNNHETLGRQTKQSNQLWLFPQMTCREISQFNRTTPLVVYKLYSLPLIINGILIEKQYWQTENDITVLWHHQIFQNLASASLLVNIHMGRKGPEISAEVGKLALDLHQNGHRLCEISKLLQLPYNWASSRENLSSGVCVQHRRRPACAFAQSDQRFCYSLIGKYHI